MHKSTPSARGKSLAIAIRSGSYESLVLLNSGHHNQLGVLFCSGVPNVMVELDLSGFSSRIIQ